MEVLNNIWSIVVALLLLSVLVMVHEYGHYKSGKLLGFSIQEFAIGMGPKLFKREKNGTVFSIRALPIGGMCRFYGEDEAPSDAQSFNAQKPWRRFLTIFAGPFMNLLFALLFAIVTLTAYGNIVPAVHELREGNSPAAAAGLAPGDVFVTIDGKNIITTDDAVNAINGAQEKTIPVIVERDGERHAFNVVPEYNEAENRNMIGITITNGRRHFGFFEAIGQSFMYVGSMIKEMFSFLGGMFTKGVQQGDVMGPVGTITFIGYAVRTGLEIVLRLIVLLSINLAVINLLPLPALDGGRLVFLVIEMVRGKPISPDKEGMVHFIGIILLFGLIILLTYQDIAALIGG